MDKKYLLILMPKLKNQRSIFVLQLSIYTMKHLYYFSALLLSFSVASCQSSDQKPTAAITTANDSLHGSSPNTSNSIHKIVVNEVIQVEKYTYLNVTEGAASAWMAVPSFDAKKGDTLYYQSGMLMTNFESKELKRTFPQILFVDKVSKVPSIASLPKEVIIAHQKMAADTAKSEKPYPNMGSSKDTIKQSIQVDKVKDAIQLSALLKDPKQYVGKLITVHGKVTKYTAEVMGKNWVHIQDGTSNHGKFEIVITTADEVQKDQTVTFEGKITLNKDFGYGYFFEVLMENGVLKK